MEASDLFPSGGKVQRVYCDKCGGHLDLVFQDFDEEVSGVRIAVIGLPMLHCHLCNLAHLPDRSRVSLIELHRQAVEKGSDIVRVTRNKTSDDFGFTKVPFQYDSDDYHYIPGLTRPWDNGFLTPVFFNREVLLKYDNHPKYRVRFASPTYGSIEDTDRFNVAFGINRHGRLVMWLGDIATLPEPEQYYLRSENVTSDHSIGSEFYDGQIEVKFTDPPLETKLFKARSDFLDACFLRFGQKIAHLEKEVLDLAASIRRPIVDTPVERRRIADILNKVYLESLDNKALGTVLAGLKQKSDGLGSLKRLQNTVQTAAPAFDVHTAIGPLYVLYDLRVAYSHLGSEAGQEKTLGLVFDRLGIPKSSDLFTTYDALVPALTRAFKALTDAVESAPSMP